MRHFSFAQPFLFSSSLLSIILEYAQRPKEDIPEATVHIFQGKAHMRLELPAFRRGMASLASQDDRSESESRLDPDRSLSEGY